MSRVLLLCLMTGCATARIIGPPVVTTPDRKEERVVVIEPFFETAEWKTEVLRVGAPLSPFSGSTMGSGTGIAIGTAMSPGMGPVGTGRVGEVTQVVKPLLAQIASLAAEHRLVLQHVQRLRPTWRVSSTSGLAPNDGPVTVVRTIIEKSEIVGTDRPLKSTAFAFGLVLLPLQIYNFWPVTETERAYGTLQRFQTDAANVKAKLVRYKTQPDSAFDASGLTPLQREFGLDMTYEEGLLADELPRKDVLIEGFSERLASAIVALVEESPP